MMMNKQIFSILLISVSTSFSQTTDHPTTREMNLIGWQGFQEFVPEKIKTVLLPTGTLEPHGVLPNGSDNLA
ncbi:MAG: creatininase family protein, partial [bacterium]